MGVWFDPDQDERAWHFLFRTAGQGLKAFTCDCCRNAIPEYVTQSALVIWHTFGDLDVHVDKGDLLTGDNVTLEEIEAWLVERDAALSALAGI